MEQRLAMRSSLWVVVALVSLFLLGLVRVGEGQFKPVPNDEDLLNLYSDRFYENETPLEPAEAAFAMLVYNMTDVTTEMIMTPLYSLVRLGVKAPIVLMVTPDVDHNVRQLVREKLGIRVMQVPPLPIPERYVSGLQAYEYLLLFTKMYTYLWTQYKRVCIVDMDMLALLNPESVLEYPLHGEPFAASYGQCGFFCVKPSTSMFLTLLRNAQFEMDYNPGLGDQFFYQKFFGDLAWQIPIVPGYNTVGFPADPKQWTFWKNETIIPVNHYALKEEEFIEENIVMYHFNGIKRKPWMRKPPQLPMKIDYRNDAYFLMKWWDIRNEMRENLGV